MLLLLLARSIFKWIFPTEFWQSFVCKCCVLNANECEKPLNYTIHFILSFILGERMGGGAGGRGCETVWSSIMMTLRPILVWISCYFSFVGFVYLQFSQVRSLCASRPKWSKRKYHQIRWNKCQRTAAASGGGIRTMWEHCQFISHPKMVRTIFVNISIY